MKCVVTGSAGFIGSHLCERLLRDGHSVTSIDAFIPYYPRRIKERNVAPLREHEGHDFHAADLRTDPLDGLIADAEVVFHVAATPGLMQSWTDFEGYWTCNVLATQRLLEAVRQNAPRLKRFIYVSTSSVYGKFANGDESLATKPISPYGVTKLAGENLCRAFAETHGLPLVVLRYFSVYGPRQRPDMGYHKFFRALLRGEPITVCGDGRQVRGNTYVSDCVEATVRAAAAPVGETYNVGGGEAASLWDILHKMEEVSGRRAVIRQAAERPGDQRYTFADTTKLRNHLGWQPKVSLDEGLARQWEWHRQEEEAARREPALAGA